MLAFGFKNDMAGIISNRCIPLEKVNFFISMGHPHIEAT